MNENSSEFIYQTEQFADIRILRYQVPGFDKLSLNQKKLIYFLSQAALCGRDILWDQNYRYNLLIRQVLEKICINYQGDKESVDFKEFEIYLKRLWFCNGIHHHYSAEKLVPGFSTDYFISLFSKTNWTELPEGFEKPEELKSFIIPLIFDPDLDAKRVNQSAGIDMIADSANNYYEGLTQKEAEEYYALKMNPEDSRPVSHGLNAKLLKENGRIVEKVWKLNAMYSKAIEQIIHWLNAALPFSENEFQAKSIELLIEYYKTGDLRLFDEYNIVWLKDKESQVDFVNGFIETYGDPMGMKGSWEALVNFKDIEATRRAETISENAQWFEDNSPVDSRFKKTKVKGVTAKVITAVQLGGDCYPATPIGINLPNADWIRQEFGSKSVTIENITYAYHRSSLENGFIEEFAGSEEEIKLARTHGFLADNLHTDMHECVGHGSGQLLPGVSTDVLKNYYSPLEEARADLFALYFMMDDYMEKIKLVKTADVARAQYNSYIRNGLMTQLVRILPGKNIEQAHMRCRQLISYWCFEKGKSDNVIEKFTRAGKTYIRINDHLKLRNLFGELLAEIQRIKSEGDYKAAKILVENYAIKVDHKLHAEVLSRYQKLGLAPYAGFINPVLNPVYSQGEIVDVEISFPKDYSAQMLEYSHKYSFLPLRN
jgi:dipeptidyl-peptidase III